MAGSVQTGLQISLGQDKQDKERKEKEITIMDSFKGKLENYKDLFSKLKYELNLLKKEVNSYIFFNFAVTAYHIKDWIKNDDSLGQDIKQKANDIFKDDDFKLCQDICDRYKHFKKKRNPTKLNEIKSKKGYGCGRYGKKEYGIGEESITVITIGEEAFNGLDLAQKIYDKWKNLIEN